MLADTITPARGMPRQITITRLLEASADSELTSQYDEASDNMPLLSSILAPLVYMSMNELGDTCYGRRVDYRQNARHYIRREACHRKLWRHPWCSFPRRYNGVNR